MNSSSLFPCSDNTNIVLSIEGNIGSGKSTLLKKMEQSFKDYNISFVFEPNYEWQDIQNENLLDNFYKDKVRWGYSFEYYCMLTRLKALDQVVKEGKTNIFITERSVYSSRFCFFKLTQDHMTTIEQNIYIQWYDWLIEEHTKKINGFIYLKTSPEISCQRILKRSRMEEKKIDSDYIKKLHQCHVDFLEKKEYISSNLKNVPVLILNGDEDFENSDINWSPLKNQVLHFIENIEKV